MHELALTEGIISIVTSEREKQGFSSVLEIKLRIGEYSGVIPECIEEFFPIAAAGTAAAGARLVIEHVPAEFECRACHWRGKGGRGVFACPECLREELKMISGREFYVESLKVE